MSQNKKDNKNIKKPETTGHSWDGVEEYNTPAPRWWLSVWLVTIIWAFIYWIFFPTWPTLNDHSKGSLEWTSKVQLAESEQEIKGRRNLYLKKFRESSFKQVANNPKLFQFAINGGRAAFKENCAACHGTGAAGFKGFPNLNDDDWLWGGSYNNIYKTLLYGIRSGHEKARESQMPAFGRDGILSKDQIKDVSQYVKSLSGNADYNKDGRKLFVQNCAVCHGWSGKGDRSLGAPDLSDAIWLYGIEDEDIIKTIYYSRNGVMPAWKDRLSDDTIRQLTIYIHSLGGGEF